MMGYFRSVIMDFFSGFICRESLRDFCPSIIFSQNDCNVRGLWLWCLMPLSIIFQLYHSSQFYWWRKLEYQQKIFIVKYKMKTLLHGNCEVQGGDTLLWALLDIFPWVLLSWYLMTKLPIKHNEKHYEHTPELSQLISVSIIYTIAHFTMTWHQL